MYKKQKTITLAMTGASGAPYGLRLLECLLAADYQVYFLISSAARVVMATEQIGRASCRERVLRLV